MSGKTVEAADVKRDNPRDLPPARGKSVGSISVSIGFDRVEAADVGRDNPRALPTASGKSVRIV